MADKILFDLVSPTKLLVSRQVDMVVVPGAEGDFGAMAAHAPLISTVRTGIIDIHDEGKVSERIFVAGGFTEVTTDRVTVLAEEAYPLAEITKELAEKRMAAAKAATAHAKSDYDKSKAKDLTEVAEALLALAS
jgi:F-type H+-transporting ATPase subunit epsilon